MTVLFTALSLPYYSVKNKVKSFMSKENGETNIIAIIIILAIVIALAIVFRSQLKALFDQIWLSIFGNVDKATDTY